MGNISADELEIIAYHFDNYDLVEKKHTRIVKLWEATLGKQSVKLLSGKKKEIATSLNKIFIPKITKLNSFEPDEAKAYNLALDNAEALIEVFKDLSSLQSIPEGEELIPDARDTLSLENLKLKKKAAISQTAWHVFNQGVIADIEGVLKKLEKAFEKEFPQLFPYSLYVETFKFQIRQYDRLIGEHAVKVVKTLKEIAEATAEEVINAKRLDLKGFLNTLQRGWRSYNFFRSIDSLGMPLGVEVKIWNRFMDLYENARTIE